MNFQDFQQAVALLSLPKEQLENIMKLAEGMSDDERYAMLLELEEIANEDSKNMEEEENPLKEMESMVKNGEQAMKKATHDIHVQEEAKESKEAMDSIEDQIDNL